MDIHQAASLFAPDAFVDPEVEAAAGRSLLPGPEVSRTDEQVLGFLYLVCFNG